jgi:hypothetical protein
MGDRDPDPGPEQDLRDPTSRFTYSEAPQSTASDSQKCNVKKKKRGGGK